jgi:hypothetical protein
VLCVSISENLCQVVGRPRNLGSLLRRPITVPATAYLTESALRRGDPACAADRLAGLHPTAESLPDTFVRQPFWAEDVIDVSEEELVVRRALQESMDLRDQGHADD